MRIRIMVRMCGCAEGTDLSARAQDEELRFVGTESAERYRYCGI